MQYLLSLLLRPICCLVSNMYTAGMLTRCLYICMGVPLGCIYEDIGLLPNTIRNRWIGMGVWEDLNNFPCFDLCLLFLIWYYIISYKIRQFYGWKMRNYIGIYEYLLWFISIVSLVSLVYYLVANATTNAITTTTTLTSQELLIIQKMMPQIMNS